MLSSRSQVFGARSNNCTPAPSSKYLKPSAATVVLRHPRLSSTAPVRSHGRPSRATAVKVAADVNWDAFRSRVELGLSPLPQRTPTTNPAVKQYDFLVIGSGIAGLTYALKVSQYGSVAIITKDEAKEGCTRYAQGGVCAVLDQSDSVDQHVQDTMVAGAFLNDPAAVDVVCREGPARVLELVEMGAEFTRNQDGSLHLTKEGGHTQRRIVHAADLTGAEIERALLAEAHTRPSIHFYEHHLAVDLVIDEFGGAPHCFGADVLDQRNMQMCRFVGLSTMLASGGAGQVYPNTTNPHVATGDGIAMAYRASANISNMEFVQFHPTGLYTPPPASAPTAGATAAAPSAASTFLITEAVRGEGGHLLNINGERFMSRYDPERMELAPRDVVARAITEEMRLTGAPHVWLDISFKPRDEVLHHFPNIAARCAELGIDITSQPIPVVPVQHYTCGGVAAGLLGETSLAGLFACGEVACSGLHGANRLASNSLLEGLVFGDKAINPSVAHAEHTLRHCGRQLHYAAASAQFDGARAAAPPPAAVAAWATAKRAELRSIMWANCGIVRTTRELYKALDFVVSLCVDVAAVQAHSGTCTALVELQNLATVAELTVSCALSRKESRGLHYSLDYPMSDVKQRLPSIVSRPLPSRYELANYEKAHARAFAPSGGAAFGGVGNVGGGFVLNNSVPKPKGKKGAGVASRNLSVRSVPGDV